MPPQDHPRCVELGGLGEATVMPVVLLSHNGDCQASASSPQYPLLSVGPAAVCVCHSEAVCSFPEAADFLFGSLTLTSAVPQLALEACGEVSSWEYRGGIQAPIL